jgi:DNA-directed RNA polymerase subunit RPC12/RpoP
MVRRLRCPNCGEHGFILSDEPTVAALCLRCSHRLEIEPDAFEVCPRDSSAIEDAVVSWLSQPPNQSERKIDDVSRCASCGFEGLMQCFSPRGDTFCPTCMAIYRARPEPVKQLIDCPNCSRPIEVHERERGKTIVCPDCNYFLGCVLPPEKRRFAALPFLNALLGAAKG